MSNLIKSTLPNGVRVLVEPVSYVKSAAIGLWCHTGSGYEQDDERGVSHFIEHMLFKGTANRTAKEIVEEIEGRGGAINAFTDKETTCFYCHVLADDVETAVDVLSDMVTASVIDEEELNRERGVILEEIKRSQDEPSDCVHDFHMECRWPGHSFGYSILGSLESICSTTRDTIVRYMNRRYRGSNVLLAATGQVDAAMLVDLAHRLLGGLPGGQDEVKLEKPVPVCRSNYRVEDNEQVNFCIGSDACSVYDEDRLYTLSVLDAALGGGMSSRLFQEIREKRGLAYAIGSYTQTFAMGGTFTVFGGTSPEKWPIVLDLVKKEFAKVRNNGLDEAELERTKRLICGNTVLALESMSARMLRISKQELYHRREVPIEETLSRINAVSNDQTVALAQDILAESQISVTAIGPEEGRQTEDAQD